MGAGEAQGAFLGFCSGNIQAAHARSADHNIVIDAAAHGRHSRALMRPFARVILFAIALCALSIIGPAVGQSDRYAAVAFSPSTGAYGYANGYSTKNAAIARARQECGEPDAVAKWAKNAWLALAVSGDGGYGSGWGTTAGKAREMAVESCLEHNADAKVIVCIPAYR